MDLLSIKQGQLAAFIENFTTNTNKTGKQYRTEFYLTARINLLKDYFAQFSQQHFSLLEIAEEEDYEKEYFTKDVFSTVECAFSVSLGNHMGELRQFEQRHPPPSAASTSTGAAAQLPERRTKLLPPPIPKFNGDVLEWPSFKDLFTSVISNDVGISNVERLQHLKGHESGDAELLIRNITITDANYVTAWNTLVNHYENQRMIVNTHIQRLMSAIQVTKESSIDLKTLWSTVNQSVQALTNIGRPTDQWDDLLVFIVVSKLDPVLRRDWEHSISSNTELSKFSDLETFLTGRIRALEAMNCSKPITKASPTQDVKSGRGNVKAHHANAIPSKERCAVCKAAHQLTFCQAFRRKNVSIRRDIAQKSNCCFNCLNRDHQAVNCPSTNTCRHCQLRHHTLLHLGEIEAVSSSSQSQQQQQPQQAQQVSPALPTVSSSNIVSTNHSTNNAVHPSSKRVLLATAVIIVNANNGRRFRLRALLDQGSHASFITESAVQLLNLKKQRINIAISGIASTSAGVATSMIRLNFTSSHDQSNVFTTNALVLSKLTNHLPVEPFVPTEWDHLSGLQLADPDYFNSSKIDIILGADIYAELLCDGLRIGKLGSPVGQNTLLGWILSGRVQR